MLLFFAFAGILTICFGTIALVTGSSRAQRLTERRISGILALEHENGGVNQPQIQILLKAKPKGSFVWLTDVLQDYSVWQKLEAKIIQADVKTSGVTILFSSIGLLLAGIGLV